MYIYIYNVLTHNQVTANATFKRALWKYCWQSLTNLPNYQT